VADNTFTLPPVVDAASVGPLRSSLLDQRGGDLEVDASQVQRIGGLGLQVLIAASRAWAAQGRSFAIVRASPPFNDMLRLTGAADMPEFAL
jgi:chemotaxis protein CheX